MRIGSKKSLNRKRPLMSVAVSNPTKTLKLSTSTAGGAGPPANEAPMGLTSALDGGTGAKGKDVSLEGLAPVGQSTAEEEEEHNISSYYVTPREAAIRWL